MKPRFIDSWYGGKLLAFSGIDGRTDYMNGFVGRTSFCNTSVLIKLPCEFELFFDEFLPRKTVLGPDFLELVLNNGRTVKFVFVDALHILIDGECVVKNLPDSVSVLREDKNGKMLIGLRDYFDSSKIKLDIDDEISLRKRWVESVELPEGLEEHSYSAVSGAILQMKTQVYTPEGRIKHRWTTPDRWPHRGIWLWDSVFHSIGYRHLDIELARDMIDAVFDLQQEDGFIPMSCSPYGDIPPLTQPPLLALAVKLICSIKEDKAWLAEVYPKIEAYLAWDLKNHDTDGLGLVSWGLGRPMGKHRPSYGSGWDNSPRFDDTFEYKAADFNAYIASEYEILAEFAEILGRFDDARRYRQIHKRLCELMNKYMWNDDIGLYLEYDSIGARQVDILTAAGFLPIICGAPSAEQVRRMVGHFDNPETFGTVFPVPTVARSDPRYCVDMWRGPAWVNINWLIIYGLKRYGCIEYAERIRERTLRILEKYFQRYGMFVEYYDPDDNIPPLHLPRKGKHAPYEAWYHQPILDYGWSATLYVDLLLDSRVYG